MALYETNLNDFIVGFVVLNLIRSAAVRSAAIFSLDIL